MSKANIHTILRDPKMPDTLNAFKDQDGNFRLRMVEAAPSGSESGYAKGCMWVDTTNGAVYVNTGTSSSATWTALGGSGVGLSVEDDETVSFGSGGDVGLAWNGSYLALSQTGDLWDTAPSPADPRYHQVAHSFFDDFNYMAPLDANLVWTEVDDSATGTNAIQDAVGGVGSIVTAAADNDYHAISSVAEVFNLVNTKALWFEARLKLAEATTNESAWWVGLTDTLTTGGFQADAAGPLASYDGILFWKDEATMALDVETSNAGTQDTETALATVVTDTWTRVGFFVSAAATTAVVTAFYDIGSGWVQHGNTMNLTRAGLEDMHVVAGVKAGPSAAAETLQIDYIRCVQIR